MTKDTRILANALADHIAALDALMDDLCTTECAMQIGKQPKIRILRKWCGKTYTEHQISPALGIRLNETIREYRDELQKKLDEL